MPAGMATTERLINAPAEKVFAVLADPESYAHWVVGSNEIRAYDHDWPRVDSTFHHTQGKWPLTVKDTSSVLESQPNRRLVLEVRTRPFLIAKVELDLTPQNGGTCVRMVESPTGGLLKPINNPLLELLTHLRNRRGLGRLGRLAEAVRD
jgi:uncharacterized protein YndB with AHSA1/START domain